MTEVLLIDGDIPKYTTAFACADETEQWKVDWTAKCQMEDVCALSGSTHYLSFLTDSKSNFRNTRATTWPYKGKRDQKDPLLWLPEIASYYQTEFDFQMMYGVEADDALTIAAEYLKSKGLKVACATKDKDLKQYPWDKFVDMNTNTVYSISPAEAHRNFWYQMLLGDVSVDNIPGLSHAAKYGGSEEFLPKKRGPSDLLIGKKTANDLLDSWDPKEYDKRIYEMYVELYWGTFPATQEVLDSCVSQGLTFGEYRFYETFDLLYMLREPPKDLKIHYSYKPVPVKSKKLRSVVPEFGDVSGDF